MNFSFYTAIIGFSCLTLTVLSVLIHENGRLDLASKRKFYVTYTVIAVAAMAEWGAIFLNGAPEWTRVLHMIVKAADYICTPIAGALFAALVSERKKRSWVVSGFLLLHAVFQIVSMFTGWIFYLDEANYYHHGKLYFIYIIVFFFAFAYVIFNFVRYGLKYTRRNFASLVAIVLLAFIGIVFQEFVSSDIRTAYISLSIGSVLLYIHYIEYGQMTYDDAFQTQKNMLETDQLSGVGSRYAFSQDMEQWEKEPLPADVVVFSADLNYLKIINDTFGHDAGDRMIQQAGQCLLQTFSAYGKTYRTGGDEFISVIRVEQDKIQQLCNRLEELEREQPTADGNTLSFSYGYAVLAEFPALQLEQLMRVADQRMYAMKAKFHENSGFDYGKEVPKISP